MPGSPMVAEQFASNLAQNGQHNPEAAPKYWFLLSLPFLTAEKDKLPGKDGCSASVFTVISLLELFCEIIEAETEPS